MANIYNIGIHGAGALGRKIIRAIMLSEYDKRYSWANEYLSVGEAIVLFDEYMNMGVTDVVNSILYDSMYPEECCLVRTYYEGGISIDTSNMLFKFSRPESGSTTVYICRSITEFEKWQSQYGATDLWLDCMGVERDTDYIVYWHSINKYMVLGTVSADTSSSWASIVAGVNDSMFAKGDYLIQSPSIDTIVASYALNPVRDYCSNCNVLTYTSYTNLGHLQDYPSSSYSLAERRALGFDIVPSKLNAIHTPQYIGHILPELNGKVTGQKFYVPTNVGAMTTLTILDTTSGKTASEYASSLTASGYIISPDALYTKDETVSTVVARDTINTIHPTLNGVTSLDSLYIITLAYDAITIKAFQMLYLGGLIVNNQ